MVSTQAYRLTLLVSIFYLIAALVPTVARFQDPTQAIKWYRKAAEQGDADAQSELGRCYFYGIGTRRDYKKAVYWCRKAAKAGKADAQYALAYCYEHGDGVARNKKLAIQWYQAAAKQHHKDAQIALKELTL